MTIHESHGVVEVWGSPEGKMPREGRWCDDTENYAVVIYHREPQHVRDGEWFCGKCGGTTFPDERIGQA